MSTSETRPAERSCGTEPAPPGQVEIIEPREVPLGGPRAMTVRRTLPARGRTMIGAWCFLDHYGPDDVAATGGMRVPPHPHTGLQTVTWLFEGSVLHRDALGSEQTVVPGQLNLMTAGRGVCHSEESTPAVAGVAGRLHGVQLWTALPDAHRHGPRAFEHVARVPVVAVDGARVQVFLGSLAGATSPARGFSPLVAAQVDVPAGATVRLPVDPTFEYGLLVDTGDVALDGTTVPPRWLGHVAPGADVLTLTTGDAPVRAVLIGGTPFDEQVLMWWNFVGRTHEEVVEARAQWQAAIAGDPVGVERFGVVTGYDGGALPAPELPHVRLRPRER